MNTKNIKSRYGQIRTITEQADGSFIVEGETEYYRCAGLSEDVSGLYMIDFEGGPYIQVGDPLLDSKDCGIVKSIEIIKSETEGRLAVKVICA